MLSGGPQAQASESESLSHIEVAIAGGRPGQPELDVAVPLTSLGLSCASAVVGSYRDY